MQFVYSHKKALIAGMVALVAAGLAMSGKMTPLQATTFAAGIAAALGLETGKPAEGAK